MKNNIITIRIFFLLVCFLGCVLIWYQVGEWSLWQVLAVGMCMAALVILTDLQLKGFSLRSLSALTFGLAVGGLIAYLVNNSPLFVPLKEDPRLEQTLYLSTLVLYIVSMYLATVIALRGKDEFNLVIPYVRFSAQNVENSLVVVDTSALIDGRIADICETKWMGYALVIPRFVLNELHEIADSSDMHRKEKGRKGLEVLNKLRQLKHLDLRIYESDVPDAEAVDSKLVFLAVLLNAKLLTMDYNLAKMAEFQEIDWLNITSLSKAINQEIALGSEASVELVRAGKDPGQAIGYLPDGSMLVVNNGRSMIGKEVVVEINSVVPSAGGKMIFASLKPEATANKKTKF
jgi:uncharacterized protein YacL